MTNIGAKNSLMCKLLSGTLNEAALGWYMNLLMYYVTTYQDLHIKPIHRLLGITRVNVCFNKSIIKVIKPNQEMFVGAFQNRLKSRHFNEFIIPKNALSMHEIMGRAECYLKCEKRNSKKNP